MGLRRLKVTGERPGVSGADLYCLLPFSEISILENGDVFPNCCPDWVDFPMGNLLQQSWDDVWNGRRARQFRRSMLKGNPRHCDERWCPHLQNGLRGAEDHRVVPLAERPDGPRWTAVSGTPGPLAVGMHYDASCNLACPTCRAGVESATGPAADRVRRIHEVVERDILPTATAVNLTGTGDPFASSFLRSFLTHFDRERYPLLENVHLHTNAIMWTESMWAKMPGLHEMPISTDVSIDAATAETYEVVRAPARWDVLGANMDFILSLPNVHSVGISMTVSQLNFRELMDFHEFGQALATKCPEKYFYIEYKRARRRSHHSRNEWRTLGLEHLDTTESAELLELLGQLGELRSTSLADIRSNLGEFSELAEV